MALTAVRIHPSQFPGQVRRDLIESLRRRQVQHKFHYDSVKQTQQWLALHDAYSPARTDPDCTGIYEACFAAAANRWTTARVHVIGLGCGGGQKDERLIRCLREAGRQVTYTPFDVSVAMVLVASQAVQRALGPVDCSPLVGDLAAMEDLPEVLVETTPANAARLITFFGMIPNFEPELILPRLARAVRPQDGLLFSANLLPGPDDAAGFARILHQYDNTLTRQWLLTFLRDLGVENQDGELRFSVADAPGNEGLKRVEARFHFLRACEIRIDSDQFSFSSGESMRLFFSYRYKPVHLRCLLAQHGLDVHDQWTTKSEEEGVFLCSKHGMGARR
jgi:L-histidine N-alpha-methyltransferase